MFREITTIGSNIRNIHFQSVEEKREWNLLEKVKNVIKEDKRVDYLDNSFGIRLVSTLIKKHEMEVSKKYFISVLYLFTFANQN